MKDEIHGKIRTRTGNEKMNIEEQREKIGPWMPAVFCGIWAIILMIMNIWCAWKGISNDAVLLFFMGAMPVCFILSGEYLLKLKKEIAELRERLDAADRRSDSPVAPDSSNAG